MCMMILRVSINYHSMITLRAGKISICMHSAELMNYIDGKAVFRIIEGVHEACVIEEY